MKKERMESFYSMSRTCNCCGKTFIPTYGWVYRDKQRSKWYCKYSCLRKDTADIPFKNKPTTPYTY